MAPMYGQPNYNFLEAEDELPREDTDYKYEQDSGDNSITIMAFWYMIVLVGMLLVWLMVYFCLRIMTLGQKTRNQQQRRVYGGTTRGRSASVEGEPTIFVSPANLPPPPKYEALAPPSYEEVMRVNYPNNYQSSQSQPIEYPITHAIAQSSNQTRDTADGSTESTSQSTVITVTADERRTSVTVATT